MEGLYFPRWTSTISMQAGVKLKGGLQPDIPSGSIQDYHRMSHFIAPPSVTIRVSSRDGKKVFKSSSKEGHAEALPGDANTSRRMLAYGLMSAAIGLSVGPQGVIAAARRAPPPPPQEKKDPNMSGVVAKVLASKKRKEAMKEAVAKMREKGKGKPVN